MTSVREAEAVSPNQGRRSQNGSFIWYELTTSDPIAAGAFYSAVVPGWKFGERVPGDVDYRMIKRSDGGNAGGVLRLSAQPGWMGYVGVPDVDATVARIEKKGGDTLMPPWDVPGVGRLAMVADPQGNPIYLIKPQPPEGDPNAVSDVFSSTEEQHVSWNELATTDPVAAREFYGELFGWTSDEFMPMGEHGEYRFFAHQGMTIGAVSNCVDGAPARWRYYIRVPSISAAVEAVKAGGGSVSMGPHEVPGGDFIVIGNDPQGAEFALVGKA